MKTIEIKNLGPVLNCTIPIPERGGVVCLSGRNGSGKSETLAGVQKMLTGKGEIATPTDGYDRGTVTGVGGSLTFGRSTRRTGELEVVAMDSRLSVADVVDPQIKDPLSADEKRIKAILAILQVRPDLADWAPLADGDPVLESQISDEFKAADDVLILASRIKRMIGARASQLERDLAAQDAVIAELSKDERVTARETPATPPGHAALSETFTAAVNRLAELEKQQSKAATVGVFREEIERLREELCDLEHLKAAIEQRNEEIKELEDRLSLLRAERASAITQHSAGVQAEERITALEKKIEGAASVPAGAIEVAQAEVEASRNAFAEAEATRNVLAARQKLATATTLAASWRSQVEAVRKAAQRPDAILAQLVQSRGVGIEIDDGRLRVRHKRGKVLYADLSQGERWTVAMRVAVTGIGPGGLLVLPQEAWESLDPTNRELVADLAVEHQVVILTADASNEPSVVAMLYGQ